MSRTVNDVQKSYIHAVGSEIPGPETPDSSSRVFEFFETIFFRFVCENIIGDHEEDRQVSWPYESNQYLISSLVRTPIMAGEDVLLFQRHLRWVVATRYKSSYTAQ